jgi:hypothetical protein
MLMKTLHTWALLSAGALLLGWSGPNGAEEPASFARTAKELGFPATGTTITFTRLAQHTYRVQFSTPPPSGDYLMLYTELYFCGARKLALDAGFDRVALVPDPESPQGGIAVFLKPGEDATKVLEPRFIIGASFDSIELFANCPPLPPSTKQ